MEMMSVVDGNNGGTGLVVTELSHIKELVRQLELHLGGSPDLCKHLTSQIFSLTERSIGLITSSSGRSRKRSVADADLASPLSATATPTSDMADGPFKNTKKRKVMQQRRERVSSAGGDNPVDDGHSWRKYGQKEILGAKHPRSYYRCTHRHSQGCWATKQVQRADEDPSLYDVIYHGDHTCADNHRAAVAGQATLLPRPQPEQEHGHLQSLSAGLTVKTEGLPVAADPQGWSATTHFNLSASTPVSGGCMAQSTSDNWGVSPATSDSNNHVASYVLPFEDADWRGQAEIQEVVSALVAASAPLPPLPAVDSFDDLLIDMDFASFFA